MVATRRKRRTNDELITDLEAKIQMLRERIARRARKEAERERRKAESGGPRFSPKWLASHRKKLDLSAADYAELLGVAPLTVYNWEKGKSRPRTKQLAAIADVRKLTRREAWERLGWALDDEPPTWFSAEWVAKRRVQLDLSAADFAELVGVTGQTIYNWEKGRSTPAAEQIESLEQVRKVSKKEARQRIGKPEHEGPTLRFSPEWVARHRSKLELSAADYAELVGVAPLTIYNWERGKSRPRAAQLEALAEVRALSKREAWSRLGYE